MTKKISPNSPCPCYAGRKYKQCCRPYHKGRPTPSPVWLMRSRYAAYALHDIDFIMQTTHPVDRVPDEVQWRADLMQFVQATEFVGLTILAEDDIAATDNTGQVTFRAELIQRGQDASFTERSLFERQDGRWFYRRPVHRLIT